MATSVPPSSGNNRVRRPRRSGRPPASRSPVARPRRRLVRQTSGGEAVVRVLPRRIRKPVSKKLPLRQNRRLVLPKLGIVHRSPLRFVLVWGILTASAILLMLNLIRLQVIMASDLQEKAREQQMVYLRPFLPRRRIVDQVGNTLAFDSPVYTLYAHPRLFKEPKEAIARALAPVISHTESSLVQLFNQGESGLEVEYTLTEDIANQVRDLQLDGLELIQKQQRLYPQEDLFSDIVGYVNVDRQGQAGVEYSHQTLLERPVDEIRLIRAGDGSIIPSNIPERYLRQDDYYLQLSVDSRLQRIVRSSLRDQMKNYKAKRGAVIVMNVHDGSVLSMVSEPTYDPNQYFKYDLEKLHSWALTTLYEPGSTFKPINVAIALESGAVRPDDAFYDEGQIMIGQWTIQNSDFSSSGGRGTQSVTDIVKYSSNVGMVHIMQQLKRDNYYTWLQKLGLGQSTGIDLPFEAQGQIKDREQFVGDPVEAAVTAFGQGFSLTPIQLIQLHSALANGGKLLVPHVVQGLYDNTGKLHWKPNLPPPRRLFSPQNTQAVLKMMEAVVDSGTGETAQITGYRIAGKTGTAQKASATGGYEPGARITSFVSIFPAEQPRYAVLVVVDEPQGDDAYGSTVAAPVAKVVMEALITTERVPPEQVPPQSTP